MGRVRWLWPFFCLSRHPTNGQLGVAGATQYGPSVVCAVDGCRDDPSAFTDRRDRLFVTRLAKERFGLRRG